MRRVNACNTLSFATAKPTDVKNLQVHFEELSSDGDTLLPTVLQTVQSGLKPSVPADFVFTDDIAPVETIVDSLVIRYFLTSENNNRTVGTTQ